MSKLDQLLQEYALEVQTGGPAKAKSKSLTGPERDALVKRLRVINVNNDQLVWIIVVMLLIIFAVTVWLVVFKQDLKYAQIAIGIMGITSAGSINWLKSLWSEKSAIEQLLELAISFEGPALEKIIQILAAKSLAS